MSDSKSNRGVQDRSRINLTQDYEVRYWSKEFGITPRRLRELVEQLGNSAETIRDAASGRKPKEAPRRPQPRGPYAAT
jgi:hypothetical protein